MSVHLQASPTKFSPLGILNDLEDVAGASCPMLHVVIKVIPFS